MYTIEVLKIEVRCSMCNWNEKRLDFVSFSFVSFGGKKQVRVNGIDGIV